MSKIMVDLETMGTSANAAIIAIGAVEFNTKTGEINADKFYVQVSLSSAVRCGSVIEPATVMWWMQQSDEARRAFKFNETEGIYLTDALQQFSTWIGQFGTKKTIEIWGNGAAFDNVVLASAYKNTGYEYPCEFWNDKCYRTIKGLRPDIKIPRSGTHHNALDDAESQAKHMILLSGGTPQ